MHSRAPLSQLRVTTEAMRTFRVGAHEMASMVQLVVTRALTTLGASTSASTLDAAPDTATFAALRSIRENQSLYVAPHHTPTHHHQARCGALWCSCNIRCDV